MLKIGIVAVGYQCENLNEILCPWIKLKNLYPNEITISITSALFKEQWDLGKTYSNNKMEKEVDSLLSNKDVDYFNIVKTPILDFQSRNHCWENLKKHDLDLVWQLDIFDEYYSFEEIVKTINWISEENLYDTYHINFKNYIGVNKDRYVLDFAPARINWVKKNNGIKNWYWDNWLEYNNGKKSELSSRKIIPKAICNPKHLSWVGSKEFLINKINYQHKAIGCCSYSWNNEKQDLDFDYNYYRRFNISIPEIYKA
jgi:hypothetical protein